MSNPAFHQLDAPDVPPIRGHYSHAVELPNGFVCIAGQKAWDPTSGNLIAADITTQTGLVFDNIEGILRQLGLRLNDVIRIQCHLADISHYDAFNTVYTERLGEARPARTVLGGYDLREGALVELVVDAFRPVSTQGR